MHIHEVLPQNQIQQPKSQLLPKQPPPLDCKRREKKQTKKQKEKAGHWASAVLLLSTALTEKTRRTYSTAATISFWVFYPCIHNTATSWILLQETNLWERALESPSFSSLTESTWKAWKLGLLTSWARITVKYRDKKQLEQGECFSVLPFPSFP